MSGYTYYSNTSSGWTISTDPEAAQGKRWRAVHPDYGERFFATHDEILPFTCQHLVERFKEFLESRFK
jgi:hypothetical protein